MKNLVEKTSTDEQLWIAMRGGDTRAFEQMYRLYSEALYRYASRFSSDEGAIQDCLHDLFCDIWTRRETLGHTDSILRYLMVALRRRIIKLHENKAVVWTDEFPLLAESDGDSNEDGPISPVQLEQALNELSAREREALYLKYYAGMNYEEMSETMQMQYQSLRNLVHRALIKMRGLLGTVLAVWAGWKELFFLVSTK